MPEKTWDMIYDAIIDLTKAVNALNEKYESMQTAMNARFDRVDERLDRLEERVINIESDLSYTKVKLFDTEKELHVLKDRRS